MVVGYELAGHVLLIAAAIALGDSVRSRREIARRTRTLVSLTAAQQRRDAEAEAQRERAAIARDLHDSIGHSAAVISLHADVAREALGPADGAARAAVTVIKQTTTAMMTELRRTVRLLRTSGESARPRPSLANLAGPIGAAAPVAISTDVPVADGLPRAVDAVAFRIVQESITNIVKHSTASHAHVEAVSRDRRLHLSIVDNGRERPPDDRHRPAAGHGITGMRERAEALGGTLATGYEPGGFAVRAVLPYPEPE